MWVRFLGFCDSVDFLKQFVHGVFLKPASRMHIVWFQFSFLLNSLSICRKYSEFT